MIGNDFEIIPVADMPGEAVDADWIFGSRIFVVSGNSVNGNLSARLFKVGNAHFYLVLERLSNQQADVMELPVQPGVYFELAAGAFVKDDPSMTFRAGTQRIEAIIRVCSNKKLRARSESLWKQRANVLRTFGRFYERLGPGVYHLAPWQPAPASVPAILLSEQQIERTNDYLWSRIFNLMTPKHADLVRAKTHLGRLYDLVGLKLPPVIIAPSPLTAEVAATVAGIYWAWQRNGRKTTSEIVQAGFVNNAIKAYLENRTTFPTHQEYSGFDWAIPHFEGTLENAIRRNFSLGEVNFPSNIGELDVAVRNAAVAAMGDLPGVGSTKNRPPYMQPEERRGYFSEYDLATDLGRHASAQLFAGNPQLADFACEYFEHFRVPLFQMSITTEILLWVKDNFIAPGSAVTHDWEELSEVCANFWLHEKFCVLADFPQAVRADEFYNLHNDSGPAIEWRDGFRAYYLSGMTMTRQVVEAPETLTIDQIMKAHNAETRRVMIARYGTAKFLENAGAKVIQQDRFGALMRLDLGNDESLTMVKVKNATPEPDGTYKFYYLRVPEETTTAHEGVAWTFGMRPEEYDPMVET